MIPPLARQLLVAGSTHLAALSAGGMVAYPSVLLRQLKTNDSIIQIDLHNGSWIGSVHGIAGLPSIMMPLLMQYKGRKLAFLLSCILIIIGWVFMYFAQNITTLIIGECFQGLGGNSLLSVSILSVSEMVQPKYRNTCLSLYCSIQAFGISAVGILGRYLHWKTVGLIMGCPILFALPVGCTWPESPSWLAWKGRFEECQRTFERLRGTDEESKKELKALVSHYQKPKKKQPKMQWLTDLRKRIVSRDFYLPTLHNMVLISITYWGGGLPLVIYSTDMILKASGRQNDTIKLVMDITLFLGYSSASALVRYYSAKKVMIFSMAGSAVFITAASAVTYLQNLEVLLKDSDLSIYLLAVYVALMSSGSNSLGFCIASEVMPVKHKGLGGCLYVVFTCIFHASSLKAYPYLCLYINIWGVFLIYGAYNLFCTIIIGMFVPETQNRTLQEIEEYYNNGYFKETTKDDDAVIVPFIKSEIN